MKPNSLENPPSFSESIDVEQDSTDIFTDEAKQSQNKIIGQKIMKSIKGDEEINNEYVPDGYLNVAELGSKIDIDKAAISELAEIKKLGIEFKRATYFSKEEQQIIEAFFKENVSTKNFFDDTHYDKPITRFIIKSNNLGIKLGIGIYLSKEDRQVIENFFNNYLDVARFGKENHWDAQAVRKFAEQNNLGEKIKKGNKIVIYLSQEDQSVVKEFFDNNISVNKFKISIKHKTVLSLVRTKKLGTQLGKGIYLSKEDQQVIKAFFDSNANIKKVANNLKKNEGVIRELASLRSLGTQLGQATYFSKEDIRDIEAFFEKNKSVSDYAGEIQRNPPVVKALVSLKNLGIQLGQGVYLSKEDQQATKAFFDDNIVSSALARDEKYDKNAVFDLSIKKSIGVQLHKYIYLSKEDQQTIKEFFEENKNAENTAAELGVLTSVLRTLARLKQLGIQLGNGLYFSKEDIQLARNFFNNTITPQVLGREINFNPSAIAALAHQEKIGVQLGTGSDVTFYFTKEEQQTIHNLSKNLLSISDVATKLESNIYHINAVIEMLGCEKKQLGNGFYIDKKDLSKIAELSNEIKRKSGSIPENITAFYLNQTNLNIKQHFKPKWLKGLRGGQSEIDIFIESDNPPPPGIGIEYDGQWFHDEEKKPSDIHKNKVAEDYGIEIIRIRENGCPELPSNITCIAMQDNNKEGLASAIERLFTILHIPLPAVGIDIKRDKQQIFDFMRVKINQAEDEIAEESIEEGILATA